MEFALFKHITRSWHAKAVNLANKEYTNWVYTTDICTAINIEKAERIDVLPYVFSHYFGRDFSILDIESIELDNDDLTQLCFGPVDFTLTVHLPGTCKKYKLRVEISTSIDSTSQETEVLKHFLTGHSDYENDEDFDYDKTSFAILVKT